MSCAMSLNDLKEGFSLAYVRAVAHAAGYFTQDASRAFDSDGIDVTLLSRAPGGAVRSPRLDLQVKATARLLDEGSFPFDLDVKNYNELRSEELQVPRILVVVVLPEDASNWVSANEECLCMRHCGYWKSLRGYPPTENTSAVRVWLERAGSGCFHIEQIRSLMAQIRLGGVP